MFEGHYRHFWTDGKKHLNHHFCFSSLYSSLEGRAEQNQCKNYSRWLAIDTKHCCLGVAGLSQLSSILTERWRTCSQFNRVTSPLRTKVRGQMKINLGKFIILAIRVISGTDKLRKLSWMWAFTRLFKCIMGIVGTSHVSLCCLDFVHSFESLNFSEVWSLAN